MCELAGDSWPNVPEIFGLGWKQDVERELRDKGAAFVGVPGKGIQANFVLLFLQKIKDKVKKQKNMSLDFSFIVNFILLQ
jgi:hypothetical protein